jgi:PIN domain nuclease of toxin-antitoxin system
MTVLLDTHFLLWLVLSSERLRAFPWLDRYRPWAISPVSLLEIQFLAEVGRVEVTNPNFAQQVSSDARFLLDDAPMWSLFRHALPLDWTRDPFDRLLAAHSLSRRMPLCTVDRNLRAHHSLVVEELRE